MPWKETCLMNERVKFIGMYLKNELSISELCRYFGISRVTGYKWIGRYEHGGASALEDKSRAPHHHPHEVSQEILEAVLVLRRKHPTWGPKKLRAWLESHHPSVFWPAISTVGEILKRHGLTVPRRRSRRGSVYEEPFIGCERANDVWSADFKGWFNTRDGIRCDPLTISDNYSRLLIRCQVVVKPDYEHVQPVFEAAFREYGLPTAIRTDNGAPFATNSVGGLSRLSIWWLKLGIIPERIKPARPSQNGRHERMHRTLKQETANPPKWNRRAQQRAFDNFRKEYNYERPHEGIGMHPPDKLYQVSMRPYPSRVPEISYPDRFVVRKVYGQGNIVWKSRHIFFSETLAGENVGCEQIDNDLWQIYFGVIPLAKLNTKTLKIKRQKKISLTKNMK